MFESGKVFNQNYTVVFRQWRAEHSHCRFFHGYSLKIEMAFESLVLDDRNWVVDFGALDPIKDMLKGQFDHKLIVAADDPQLDTIKTLEENGLAQIIILPHVSCERFAEYIYNLVEQWLRVNLHNPESSLQPIHPHNHEVQLAHVIVRENDTNWGKFRRNNSPGH